MESRKRIAYLVVPGAEVYLSKVIKLLVFDLDGTLVDTREDLGNSVNHALVQKGLPALPMGTILAAVGDGARNLIERSLRIAKGGVSPSPAETESVLSAFLEHYNEHCLIKSVPYPGVAAALEKLAGYPKAVLTNKPGQPARRILEGLDLAKHFEWIVGGDNPFGQKPDPAALNHLLTTAGVEAGQAALIGDGIQDLKAAQAAGTHFIAFLAGIGDRQTLLAGHPESTLEDMHSLPAALSALDAQITNRIETRNRAGMPASGGRP